MSEHAHQVALMGWAKNKESEIPELALLFAVPNGGKRDVVTATMMKKEGVKKGVPDLFLPVPRGTYHGLFIEMKHGDNNPSAEQIAWMVQLEMQGYETCVAYSWQEASESILAYLDGRPVLRKVKPPKPRRSSTRSPKTANARLKSQPQPCCDAVLQLELDAPL